jgi:outer membrane protein
MLSRIIFVSELFTCILFFFVGVNISFAETTGTPSTVDLSAIRGLTLKTAQQIALAENPSLAAAQERVMQAQARVRQETARYWPKIDGTASYRREWFSDNIFLAGRNLVDFVEALEPTFDVEIPEREDFYVARLLATWILFDGFSRKFSNAAARFAQLASKEAQMDARRLLALSVADSFHNAQLARENIFIAQADEAFNRKQMEEAKARQRVGTGSISDVLNLEVQANTARSGLFQAERNYEIAQIGLAALMGIPGSALPSSLELSVLEPEIWDEMVLPKADPLISYAQKHRPDLLQNKHFVEQTNAGVGIARSEFYPIIELFGSADGERADDLSFKSGDFGYTVGAQLTYNFFSGGRSLARVQEANARMSEAKRNYENLSIRVAYDVREAIADLKRAQNELVLQRTNAEIALENRDRVEKEYSLGHESLVRLNEAQRDLIRAQSQLARALVSVRQAWENLASATSENIERMP